MSWLSKFVRQVKSWLQTVWEGVAPKVRSDFERFATEFADIALEEISKQALLTISGQQKLDAAAGAVLKRAEEAGWTILRTAAVTLVQDIYTAQKAKQGPLVAPPGDLGAASAITSRTANPNPDA
jgi:hypothetical protein